MTVVPSGAKLISFEFIRMSVSWGDGAFCDAVHAVVVISVELTDSVPVQLLFDQLFMAYYFGVLT